MGVLTEIFLPLSLAFIMFSMGLALTIQDFKRIVIRPKAFALGALAQVILLPVVSYLLIQVWSLDSTLAVGVMILAACPGGATSNLLTHLAKGDTALSVTLTAVISLLGVITIPFLVNFSLAEFTGAREYVALPIGKTVLSVFFITTLPMALGMCIKGLWGPFADRMEPRMRMISAVLFIIIVLGAIAKERSNFPAYFAKAGSITLALNLIMMTIGFYIPRLFALGRRQSVAVSLESGLQNGTLAIFVAVNLLGDIGLAIPAVIYSLLMFVTAGGLVFAGARGRSTRRESGSY
ncbi:MAG: bile acid:sodium symporter family protein [Bacteriovoracales bacterium]|nr:bile acid:sodium symporter family protein [Bacteriovoracales bacterium]